PVAECTGDALSRNCDHPAQEPEAKGLAMSKKPPEPRRYLSAPKVPSPEHPPRPKSAKATTKPPFPTTSDVQHVVDTSDGFECLTDTGGPPDTNGAVGPNHLFTTLNYRMHAQKKDGTKLGTVYPWDFWQPVAPNLYPFDPRVVFDPHTQRW